MVEIYNKLKVLCFEKKEIEIVHNPQSIIGCTISDTDRLLYLVSEPEDVVLVDFIPQRFGAKELIFIPAHHLLYFPETESDCYCIHMPQCCLSDIQRIYLLRLVYQSAKTIRTGAIDPDNFDPDQLFNALFRCDPLFMRSLPPLQYVHKAVALMDVLKSTKVDFKLNLNGLAASIHVSEKTLYRITKSVFNLSPSHLLNYYVQLKIIFRITLQKLHTFFDISEDLRCSDVSSFGRYVKSLSGLTPKEIRNKFYHIRF